MCPWWAILAVLISIHSPRMGRDHTGNTVFLYSTRYFNPLSPHGERLIASAEAAKQLIISIHSPRMGRDFEPFANFSAEKQISIHSPRMGRDESR